MNKNLKELVLNDPCYNRLLQDISRNHLTHAQLICCADEEYSKSFSLCVMQSILEKNGLSELSHKIENGSFLDVFILENSKSIKVEDISLVLENSSKRGVESDFKFFLLLGADRMTPEAQNKLLKTLEEPNPNMFFFLCAPSRFLVLQTIVSRCNVVEIMPAKKIDIINYLKASYNANDSQALLAAELSLGSTTKAAQFLHASSPSFETALSAICDINSSSDCVKYVQKIVKSDLSEVLGFLEFILLDALKLKSGIDDIWFESKREQIYRVSNTDKRGLIFIYDAVINLKELLKSNVSQVVLVDRLVLKIAEGKHK